MAKGQQRSNRETKKPKQEKNKKKKGVASAGADPVAATLKFGKADANRQKK